MIYLWFFFSFFFTIFILKFYFPNIFSSDFFSIESQVSDSTAISLLSFCQESFRKENTYPTAEVVRDAPAPAGAATAGVATAGVVTEKVAAEGVMAEGLMAEGVAAEGVLPESARAMERARRVDGGEGEF